MTTLHVVGGSVLLPAGSFVEVDVELDDGRITRLVEPGELDDGRITRLVEPGELEAGGSAAEVVDASGRYVVPGFVDIQINGGWGHDFTADPSSIGAVAAHLPSTGVTTFLPTIVTSPAERRAAAIEALAAYDRGPGSADPVGLHFEGPAIAPARRGAHDPGFIAVPAPDELDSWRPGNVRLATLAPEVDGATAMIERLTGTGVVVSIGHTACTSDQFAAARAAGASLVTHLFNAMAPFGHRSPGPIGAALADPAVRAGLICDGIHADPVAIAMAWRSLGPDRFVLVTDATAALGIDETSARLATLEVTIGAEGVRLPDGTLAGSNLRLDTAIRNLVDMTDCTPAEAIRTATTTPADALGLTDRGRIEAGARADLVILDDDLLVERTIIEGATAWKS